MRSRLLKQLRSLYHLALALLGALFYRFPAHSLVVIGVTGTKGKTTVSELIAAILEEAGDAVALSDGVRFKIGGSSESNLTRMTMPGRFFLQRFLRRAITAGCTHAVIEMTSEGAAQHRHRFLALDALVFTNLAPEHIESHGSFEKYRDAKLSIARALARSRKRNRVMGTNVDDPTGALFLEHAVPARGVSFSLDDARPYRILDDGLEFAFAGVQMHSALHGEFNLSNILAAATLTRALGISVETIKRAVESFAGVPGRMEYVREGQAFDVVVDYAHTPDSLKQVYRFLKTKARGQMSNVKCQMSKLICVLGATGGGRDKWKRPEMGRIAAAYCDHVILTNEDPYDEPPEKIVDEIKIGVTDRPSTGTGYRLPITDPQVVLDRRLAIRAALERAQPRDTVVITGKGSDPSICGPRGTKEPWSDVGVAREELRRL